MPRVSLIGMRLARFGRRLFGITAAASAVLCLGCATVWAFARAGWSPVWATPPAGTTVALRGGSLRVLQDVSGRPSFGAVREFLGVRREEWSSLLPAPPGTPGSFPTAPAGSYPRGYTVNVTAKHYRVTLVPFALLVAVTALPPATWLMFQLPSTIRAARRRLRVRRGCCGECGYDLTGNSSGVCPECGTPTRARPARGLSD